jgi:nitrogen regulation protein NR(I)
MERILIVDDEAFIRENLERILEEDGYHPYSTDNGDDAVKEVSEADVDLVLLDLNLGAQSGLDVLRAMREIDPGLLVIIITGYGTVESAVEALKLGAYDYIKKPFKADAIRLIVRLALETQNLRREVRQLRRGSQGRELTGDNVMVGSSEQLSQIYRQIREVAKHETSTVLITGESGTGKELVARALHQHSPRANKPFVALNTSAIAAELLESELFGHERGAFTGAESRRIGRFEQADGGTLFLDEIGDMSPALQTRLLRVLAESEFYRVGGQTSITVDVRVIAATNQDLAKAVSEGRFREDLYHRLNVMRINTPPLRQRREDIPLLFNHYLADAGQELGAPAKSVNSEAMDMLQSYEWPGNVRQLVNATRRLTVTAPGGVITALDVPEDLGGTANARGAQEEWTQSLGHWAEKELAHHRQKPLVESALPEFEKTLIRIALNKAKGHRQEAARLLGWGRNTLTRKIRALDLD